MLGSEVKELYAKPIYYADKNAIKINVNKVITTQEEKATLLEVQCETGDVISMKFTSRYRKEYASRAADMWLNKISNIRLNESDEIILDTSEFWSIYKTFERGASLLKGTGYKMTLNGEPKKFAPLKTHLGKDPAVYAICHNDIMLYIGSSMDYPSRWGQHVLGAMGIDKYYLSSNTELYRNIHEIIDEIEFKVLYDEKQLRELMGMTEEDFFSAYMMEYVEEKCIKHYRPKYNVAGIQWPFRYSSKAPRSVDFLKWGKNVDQNLIFF